MSGSFHSIFNLHHLRHLNLAGNNFNTTLLSYGFDRLPNLTHLNLSSSCFHGQIPVGISFLTRLVSLDLSNQDDCYWRNDYYYYGSSTLKLEKPNFKTLIKKLRFLRGLYLDGVNISFQSSEWCETTSLLLSKLQVLSLSNCGLKGPLCPSLSTLSSLSKLFLGWNPISYLPPNFMEISSRLVSLGLENCNLSGHFPTEILLLPKIQSIDISYNRHLMGQLPEFSTNNALRSLRLSFTNFSGELSESIGNLKFLTDLDLSECHFFGSIPSSIANLSNLVNLDLSDNNLSGSIPKPILQLPRLESLFIQGNSFSSMKLGMLVQIKNLRGLGLSNISMLTERDNKTLTFPQLETLILRSCNLTEFPGFIKTLDKLVDLDLSNNHIHGVVPNWLWKTTLSWVDLSFNSIEFLNQLPLLMQTSLSPKLRGLFLGSCNITAFPEFLRTLQHLVLLDLSNNKIRGAIPNWVWKPSLMGINLADNHLSSLDQLLTNHSLNTSSEGTLPSAICNLRQLSIFNASHNNLSGTIPNCLGNMSYLYFWT
ncbi:hypothetical protein GQ457_01G034190 [Hibiscus cannabinus]